jgi:hypothetical protein
MTNRCLPAISVLSLVAGCQGAKLPALENAAAAAPLADASCLPTVTNDELIAELSRRLSITNPGGSAIGSFACDSSTNLLISIVSSTGAEQTASVFTGSSQRCATRAAQLATSRQHIASLQLIEICDSSTNLMRFSVTPAGVLTQLSSQFTGNQTNCETEANAADQ